MLARIPLHLRGCRLCKLIAILYLIQLFIFTSWRMKRGSLEDEERITDNKSDDETLPIVCVVTPTYTRYVQKAELTRLSHTLMLVPKVHWIIVEDSDWSTSLVSEFVERMKSHHEFHSITHLNTKTPSKFRRKRGEPNWLHPKGVWQRNRALEWIKENSYQLDPNGDGAAVIYFADDDNTYDLQLFNEMRYTQKVSVWPVGFAGGLLVERPIVDKSQNKVVTFNSMWERQRPFPIDMSGFAISLKLYMQHSIAKFSAEQKIGYMESHFLGQLIESWDELEPKADNCSKVLVWHTQTRSPQLHEERKLKEPSHGYIEL